MVVTLHKVLGSDMVERLMNFHHLHDDIVDLLRGDITTREFSNGLKEIMQVARNSVPNACPEGMTTSYIVLTERQLHDLVATAVQHVTAPGQSRYFTLGAFTAGARSANTAA